MKLFESLKQYMNEAGIGSDPNYKQRVYAAYFVFVIKKGIGGDRTETISEIRSIPNVTTVSSEDVRDEEDFFKGLFKVKFVLEGNENLDYYIIHVLRKNLATIRGLHVGEYKGVEQVK